MNNIPSLDDLLNYGEEYRYPDLIESDYFIIDNIENNNQEQDSEEQTDEQLQGYESEQQNSDEIQEQELEDKTDEQLQGYESEQQNSDEIQEQELEDKTDEQSQGCESEQQNSEGIQQQELEDKTDEEPEQQECEEQPKDENDFDDLMDNYDESHSINNETNKGQGSTRPSDKLNDINTIKIYKVFRKLVSLSYERYQKGAYKYNKKEIVKHYITNQRFKIMDDLMSPTFKPDVYVFDLSPSNDESLEMYVNAISSVAIKNSLIYLMYNDRILRKLVIKKENSQGIDVNKVVNSQVKKYNNFDCVMFDEYCSLYEELRNIRDRKIYIFSDFDIKYDISKLSQENQDIVWFSTEKKNYGDLSYDDSFYRECPSEFVGYYVEIFEIDDIEKFIFEKNKSKYKRRSI